MKETPETPARKGPGAYTRAPSDAVATLRSQNYFLYQKIANATSATVMIHNTMSLLRFFSSAMASSTPHLHSGFKSGLQFLLTN